VCSFCSTTKLYIQPRALSSLKLPCHASPYTVQMLCVAHATQAHDQIFSPEFCTCVHVRRVRQRHHPSTPSGLALSYSCDAEVHVQSADQAPYCFCGFALCGGPQKSPWQWAWTPLWVLQTSHPGCLPLAMPSGVGHAVSQDPVHRYACFS